MAKYLSQTDIGNRALQHCGVPFMDPALGFGENSERAQQVSFNYDKLRQTELRRNLWAFATKEAMLRALDSNTMKVSPSLYSSGATYFVGSIIADQHGTLWSSATTSNIGNDPLLPGSVAWEPYFGPVTVSLYDSSNTYSSGELVYTKIGDGTYNVYRSILDGNAIHPAVPDLWSNLATYKQNDVVVQYPAWASGTTYAAGDTTLYTDGNVYTSLIAGNVGNIPPSNLGSKWALTPTLVLQSQAVPIVTVISLPSVSPVFEWQQGTAYAIGNFVMFGGLEYVAIAAGTGQPPNAAASTFWKKLTLGVLSMSLINLNSNNSPASAASPWSSITSYSIGNQVFGSDGFVYTSVTNGNSNHNPVLDTGTNWTNTGVLATWTTSFTQGGGNSLWTQVGGALFPNGVGLVQFPITYPIGTGPLSQIATKNVYPLPAGYLMWASQDPKAGSTSILGSPTELFYKDWKFENQFLVSAEVGPIWLRFVADFTDVSRMEAMFCEGLAAKIAFAIVETLTQSSAKKRDLDQEYKDAITQARLVNGIETGATEPAMDDYLAVRY
jgi:hypothetical protein